MPTPGSAETAGFRPWGVRRMSPYPSRVMMSFASVRIDAQTQLGVFRDERGQVVEMGKHGTSKGTETPTATNLDSQPDQGHDQDSAQD
ncbi:putative ATP-grasp-modified RiPP [Streptomyces buecherae]|uniref:putative ATP-grasp-modified RiPP n=1 Tax=Streptomyces buecherae TaxID=2763006 RepID=UPI0022B2999A|nr:putative ATP-grasp-modified RiPP [Streptomyces buecherae]